jgi:hypothetical protein
MDMSYSKTKRQKRFQQKDRHIERQFDIAKTHDHGYYNDNNKHKLHKKHAMNCGNPRCYMCANPRRTWGEKTIQEVKFECQAVVDERKDLISKHEWEDLNDPSMQW